MGKHRADEPKSHPTGNTDDNSRGRGRKDNLEGFARESEEPKGGPLPDGVEGHKPPTPRK